MARAFPSLLGAFPPLVQLQFDHVAIRGGESQ